MVPERFSLLCRKEVIDISDGRRLGYVRDAVLDRQGRIVSLVVPGRRRLFGLFGREDDTLVPWCHIMQLGEDLILIQNSPPAPPSERPPQP